MRASPVSSLPRHGLLLGLAMLAAACGNARAQDTADGAETTAYANITSVSIEEFTNAVRVTLHGDGLIKGEADWEWVSPRWRETPEGDWENAPADAIPFLMHDTRSQLGTFVDIARYPVSHLVFQPVTRGTRTDLKCTLVLYREAGCTSLFGDLDWTDANYWRNYRKVPLCYSIVSSQTSTEVIITVRSDQYSEVGAAVAPEPRNGDSSWLRIGAASERYAVDAVNVPLSRVLEALGERSGARLAFTAERDPWVTLSVPAATTPEILEAVSACYGLAWTGDAGAGYVISDGRATDLSSYSSGVTALVPCHYLPAKDALNLLPHVLLPYVRIDRSGNGLVVTGPRVLVDKVRADVAALDVPAPLIEVEALVLTHADERARRTVWDWEAAWQDAGLTIGPDEMGYVSGSLLDGDTDGMLALPRPTPPGGWAATLEGLSSDSSLRLLARPSARVLNGHTAELFVGDTRYVTRQATEYDYGGIRPVRTGVGLTATPTAGLGGDITCGVRVEVSSVLSVDPETKQPTSANRTLQGTMRVHDGDTIVIGGLLQETNSTQRRSLPGADDLTALRDLLGLRHKESNDEDVLVLLTARIVRDPALGPDTTRSVAMLEGEADDHAAPMDDRGASARELVRAVRTSSGLGKH